VKRIVIRRPIAGELSEEFVRHSSYCENGLKTCRCDRKPSSYAVTAVDDALADQAFAYLRCLRFK
jgi:hypothetical protein